MLHFRCVCHVDKSNANIEIERERLNFHGERSLAAIFELRCSEHEDFPATISVSLFFQGNRELEILKFIISTVKDISTKEAVTRRACNLP